MRPNNAFKPNPLRSTKHMADGACHVFGSTTQVGFTQVLDRTHAIQLPQPRTPSDLDRHQGLLELCVHTRVPLGTGWCWASCPRRSEDHTPRRQSLMRFSNSGCCV